MPGIQLMEDAKQLLVSYTWPGNIRQLKNITEQISIIETNREITAEILRSYLPAQPVSKFPALLGGVKPQGERVSRVRERYFIRCCSICGGM